MVLEHTNTNTANTKFHQVVVDNNLKLRERQKFLKNKGRTLSNNFKSGM